MIDLPLQPTRRTSFTPIEKPARVKSAATIQNTRRKYCELCGRPGVPIHQHHVRSRGARGDDSEENLLSLCWKCHDEAHRGLIPRARLLAAIAQRTVTYGDPPVASPAPATSLCSFAPCPATTAETQSTCSKFCSNGCCGPTGSNASESTNMTDLRTMSIPELDAMRSECGAKKLAIRITTYGEGLRLKSAFPLLQPYTQQISAINAEEERRQTEATESRRARRAAAGPDALPVPVLRADLERSGPSLRPNCSPDVRHPNCGRFSHQSAQ